MIIDLIADYERHLRDINRAEYTIEHYIYLLRRMDRELEFGLYAANTEDLHAWIYVDGRSSNAKSLYRTVVAGFFAWATGPDREFGPDFDPTTPLPAVTVTAHHARPVTEDVLRLILANSPGRYQVWMRLASYGGLRCVELARLDRADVTEKATWIHGKGSHERLIPTHPIVWEAVEGLPPGPVARRVDGTPADREHISSVGNQHLRRVVGGRGVSMHTLRKRFGTQVYIASGNDIRAAQELLGHARVTTTQLYVAVSEATRASAVAGLPILN
jgi:integrase/recombinase XerC